MGFNEIDFYGKQIGLEQIDETLKQFDEQARVSVSPIVVDFTDNQLTDECISKLSPLILDPRVQEIRFDNNHLTDHGIDILCRLLAQRAIPLKALSLSGNTLQEAGVNSVVRFLLTATGAELTFLGLENCNITAQGTAALCAALSKNRSLKTLNLNNNPIQQGVKQIAEFLFQNSTLETLQLCQCSLDPENTKFLGIALKRNNALLELNLDSNELNDEVVSSLIEDLIFNNKLQTYIGPDIQGQIAAICERNRTLPCNARWLPTYNPDTTLEQRMAALILDTPAGADDTLQFQCTRSALRTGAFQQFCSASPSLSETIASASYSEACHTTVKRTRTKTIGK